MNEDFLHFIWKYGHFERTGMIADTGEEIQVIALGEHNTDAGPDFINARIKIGRTIWAGNVEIHLHSSDWNDHGHTADKAYDNVILHVVCRYDQSVKRSTGEVIPCVELRFNPALFENYRVLLHNQGGLPCRYKINKVDRFLFNLWLHSLVVERLQQKTEFITRLLDQLKNNWEEAFFIRLARTFGFGLNGEPFERLARSIPFLQLVRHRDDILKLEALLMGQAGFLDEAHLYADYYSNLRREYIHLKNKYGLRPIEKYHWKFLRLRPVNFPTIRIAQFAALLSKVGGLFSQVMATSEFNDLRTCFKVQASPYWDTHYTFETPSPLVSKTLGTDAFNLIIINTVVPFLFLYGRMNDREDLKERALNWLNCLPPEKNRITRRWEQYGIELPSAFYTQGIMQLVETYCSHKRCLACSVGANIITSVNI
jgi:hypothetical protein